MYNMEEKQEITNVDKLRRRHAGDYQPVANGEVYLLPYEDELNRRDYDFFNALSDFDFLKAGILDRPLTLKRLKKELSNLDNTEKGTEFWKNFNASALNKYLDKILSKNWRAYLSKKGEECSKNNNDILRCLYLLSHLHQASPSFIRQLAAFDDIWSTEFRVYYPRKDFLETDAYGAFLSELYVNILYHQPDGIRKIIKNLDSIIDKLVEFAEEPIVNHILCGTSPDIDPPSLNILKYNQVASISHFSALKKYISGYVSGSYSSESAVILEQREHSLTGAQIVASANDYKLVAALGVRMNLGVPSYPDDDNRDICNQVYNALASDANRKLYFESEGTKGGKKDTSIASAVHTLARQNPQTIEEILLATTLDASNVPEIYSSYINSRAHYVIMGLQGPKKQQEMIDGMKSNDKKIEQVFSYIFNNNLNKILKDMEMLHVRLPNGIFSYGIRNLPSR